jgi:endonuclease/exonuclease/phosphatase family metal-dependent hydrolase
MIRHLLRRRPLPGQTVGDPTLLALALTALGVVVLLAVITGGIWFYPIGYDGLVAALLAIALVSLALGWRRRAAAPTPPTWRQRGMRWLRNGGRVLVMVFLAVWLGLLGWERLCPGGEPPPPKESPAAIRVLTWNLHCGQESGPVWARFDWAARKQPLQTAVRQAAPDVLCVQEAVAEQVAFLEQALPEHRRVGVGRDDGQDGGEFCAIYYDRRRFAEIASGTFWLEEPIDRPSGGWPNVKRICTWARLRDLKTDRVFRIYNTHSYLTDPARVVAMRILRDQVQAGNPADAVIVAGDFNAGPDAESRKLLIESGLADSATRAGHPADTPTIQLRGVRLWNIDAILVSPHWRVRRYHIVDVKPDGVFPSDHFGVLADLEWE